jgi:hypothetical protein
MVVDKNTLPIGYVLKSQDNTYRIDAVLGRGGFGITYLASAKISIGNIPLNAQFYGYNRYGLYDLHRSIRRRYLVL